MAIIEKRSQKNLLRQSTADKELSKPEAVINSWNDVLKLRGEIPGTPGFRNPQLGAIYASLAHWTRSHDIATVVMPTGTGKTETMLSLLLLNRCPKLLVVVPTDALREQISEKFVSFGILKTKLAVLESAAKHPIVGLLKRKLETTIDATEFLDQANVVVATASILAGLSTDVLKVFVEKFSDIFIDEAHHAEATTWFRIRDSFKGKRVLQFTATPYRADGKHPARSIIYTYPLKKAQQEGYFKRIEYIPIHEWDAKKADAAIAAKAIELLREDKKSFPHILLARVQTKKRADEVFEIYQKNKEFRVAKIYSGLKGEKDIRNAIINREVDVVVCVNMLGEGFDLPELKIAAFHDIKQSLPTTIQLVGRFTRDKLDEKLGTAKVVVNLGDMRVPEELDALYAQGNDWNELLPRLHEKETKREKDFYEMMEGFAKIDDFILSVNGLRPAMSTVMFKNPDGIWNPKNFETFAKGGRYELVTEPLINDAKKVFVALTAEKVFHKWTDNLTIFDRHWRLFLVHWNETLGLLFIHSSVNDSLHHDLAKAIIGDKAKLIDGEDNGQIFRCLDGLKMFKIQNVGLKELLGKLIRFRMSVGTDIAEALTEAEIKRAKKSHVFGVGYEGGDATTLGVSYKGRIWSQRTNDVDTFTKWCAHVGRKVLNDKIDANQVLKGSIVPHSVSDRPAIFPTCIDWPDEMYRNLDTHYRFQVDGEEYNFYESELVLVDASDSGNIRFGLECLNKLVAEFELVIYKNPAGNYNDFTIKKLKPASDVLILSGQRQVENKLESFLYRFTPEVWFADGSVLEGSALSKLKEDLEPYPEEKIIVWKWAGVSLNKEAQGVYPKVVDSIQYHVIEALKREDFDIIFDDDGTGEIADIVAIKNTGTELVVELYHLKFAKYTKATKKTKSPKVSSGIANLYEVCGQAQKSVRWRFKTGKEFFARMLKRKTKKKGGYECSRIEKGTEKLLLDFMNLAGRRFPLKFKIFVIQPAIQKSKLTPQHLELFAVTENHLTAKGVDLEIIGSE